MKEGSRNDALFRWMSSIKETALLKRDLANFINQTFFDPPLPDSECASASRQLEPEWEEETSFHQRNNTNNEDHKNVENVLALKEIKHDLALFGSMLKNKIVFFSENSQWFEWSGMIWEPQDAKIIDIIERVVFQHPDKFSTKFRTSNIRKISRDYKDRLFNVLTVTKEMLEFPLGKVFLNGYFLFKNKDLQSHSKQRFVTEMCNEVYRHDETLNPATRKFLYECTNRSSKNLYLLRTLIYRTMVIDPSLQTGYLLSGPPRSGKSTLLQLIAVIVGQNCGFFDLSDLENTFIRRELHRVNVLIINEVSTINSKGEKWLFGYK